MRRIGLFVALWVTLAILAIGAASAQKATNDALEARWIHAQLNDWRLGLGLDLGPLAQNETLARMAYDQASYLAGLRNLPNTTAIHNGQTGEGPRVRALWPDYAWPDYGFPGQLLLSEITWVGDRQDALDFEEGDPHVQPLRHSRPQPALRPAQRVVPRLPGPPASRPTRDSEW